MIKVSKNFYSQKMTQIQTPNISGSLYFGQSVFCPKYFSEMFDVYYFLLFCYIFCPKLIILEIKHPQLLV